MRTMRRLGVLSVIGLSGLLPLLVGTGRVVAAGGNTYYVSSTGTATACVSGNTFGTIGAALTCANTDGTTASTPDTIRIAAGTYQGYDNGYGLYVNAFVSIQGTAGSTTMDAQQNGWVMVVGSGVVSISGLTITNGDACNSSCSLFDPVYGCSGFACLAHGGGISILGDATLTINKSVLIGNTACSGVCKPGEGGGIWNVGTLTINNSTLTRNSACSSFVCGFPAVNSSGMGGGIYSSGTLTINNSTLSDNTASNASCTTSSGSPCTVGYGGGIYNASFGTLSITNSTLNGNMACTTTCENLSYCSTDCSSAGGGVFNQGTLSISNSTLGGKSGSGNVACSTDSCQGYGGGLYNDSSTSVTLTSDTITSNAAYSGTGSVGDGGGIYNNSGGPSLQNDTIKNNTPDNCAPSGSVTSCKN